MLNKIGKILLCTTLLIIIFTSCFKIANFTFHDEKRMLETIPLALGAFLFITLYFKYELSGIVKKYKLLFYVILSLLVLSSGTSVLPGWAFLEISWDLLIGSLFLFFAFLYQQEKEKFIKLTFFGLFILCITYSCRVYADYIVGLIRNNWTIWPQQHSFQIVINGIVANPNGFLGFSHVRFFNHLQTWSLPLLVFGYLYFKDKLIQGLRYLLLFFISSWWMLVFAADARGTMLASFLSILLIWILFRKEAFKFIKVYFLTATGGLVLYLLLFLFPRMGAREILTRFGSSGRFEAWVFGFQHIAEHPFLGLGPMHFSYMPLDPPLPTPHNLLIQSTAEWGIPAAFLAAGVIIYAGYKFIRQSITTDFSGNNYLTMRVALVASMTAVAIHSMFSGILNTPLSQLLFTIIGGWILGEYFNYSYKNLFKEREKKSFIVPIICFLMVLNAGYVGYHVSTDIPHLKERQERYFKTHQTNKLFTRFWSQGLIGED